MPDDSLNPNGPIPPDKTWQRSQACALDRDLFRLHDAACALREDQTSTEAKRAIREAAIDLESHSQCRAFVAEACFVPVEYVDPKVCARVRKRAARVVECAMACTWVTPVEYLTTSLDRLFAAIQAYHKEP